MSKKGYTLIELVVVLALLAMVATMVIPRIHLWTDHYLDSISRQLTYDIRFVKNQNMTQPMKTYQLQLLDSGYLVRYSDGLPVLKKRVELREHYRISYYQPTVWFNANGTPKQAQTIRVINHKTGRFREITINVNSGRILLYD
jgi:prepilin-type N-terminal cleavage/methylation domain-containing protein